MRILNTVFWTKSLSCNFKLTNWWLIGSHLGGCFCLFAPKFWEGELWLIFYHSVSAV